MPRLAHVGGKLVYLAPYTSLRTWVRFPLPEGDTFDLIRPGASEPWRKLTLGEASAKR